MSCQDADSRVLAVCARVHFSGTVTASGPHLYIKMLNVVVTW